MTDINSFCEFALIFKKKQRLKKQDNFAKNISSIVTDINCFCKFALIFKKKQRLKKAGQIPKKQDKLQM